MNYGIVRNLIGKIFVLLACLLVLPLFVCIICKEGILNVLAFLIPIFALLLCGLLLNLKKAKDKSLFAKEGFVIVALSWILMSLFGCLPFLISGEIPNFFDAFFETASGFTTTGATILNGNKVELLSKSMQFWRTFTHWIGGMGVLVFILAIIPESDNGSAVHILRAESPGPQVGKLVSKMKVSSRILYIIYIALTFAEFLLLWIGNLTGLDQEMDFFNSVIYALGTAGTGGFAIKGIGLAAYAPFSQYVIASFMLIFAINFNMFYFILIKNFKDIKQNEELKWFLGIVLGSILIIFLNIKGLYNTYEEAFRHSFFQTTSIISTTGFNTIDINAWPVLSKAIIILLMIMGGCAGSTAGGFKVSRLIILIKSGIRKIKKMINPRRIETVSMDGKPLLEETVDSVHGFMIVYFLVFLACTLLVSIDGVGDILSNITASISCISNVGPFLSNTVTGLDGTFANYSWFSKLIFSFEMIAGRLELFPILILFSPFTWTKNKFKGFVFRKTTK